MSLRFRITRTKRELIPTLVLMFLLQSIVPAMQGAMAATVAGYTDIVCTTYGTRLVFVPLEQQPRQIPPACDECPACILQLDDDEAPLGPGTPAERIQHLTSGLAAVPFPAPEPGHSSLYLIRGPPA